MELSSLRLLSLLARKTRSLLRLPLKVLTLAGLAWGLLWLARLLIWLVPLRHLSPLYGVDHGANAHLALLSPAQLARAQQVRRALALALRYSPGSTNCYPQALVARLLLGLSRLPYSLCFGLAPGAQAMQAHAWVMAGPLPVSGGNGFTGHTVVRCFSSLPLPGAQRALAVGGER